MRASLRDIVWDTLHIFSSGTYIFCIVIPHINHIEKKHIFGQVRKFLREAEENGESEDLNGKGAGPADDKCFLCQKVILMLIMMPMLIMLMVVIMQR